jgi:hypothetical protein
MSVVHSVRYDWCRSEKGFYLPFDFVIEDLKLIIELDGPQHFRQIKDWLIPEETQANDVIKMHKALQRGYSCIRLLQSDVWHDKNDWQSKLLTAIHVYEFPTVIFINHEKEYDVYRQLMNNDKI